MENQKSNDDIYTQKIRSSETYLRISSQITKIIKNYITDSDDYFDHNQRELLQFIKSDELNNFKDSLAEIISFDVNIRMEIVKRRLFRAFEASSGKTISEILSRPIEAFLKQNQILSLNNDKPILDEERPSLNIEMKASYKEFLYDFQNNILAISKCLPEIKIPSHFSQEEAEDYYRQATKQNANQLLKRNFLYETAKDILDQYFKTKFYKHKTDFSQEEYVQFLNFLSDTILESLDIEDFPNTASLLQKIGVDRLETAIISFIKDNKIIQRQFFGNKVFFRKDYKSLKENLITSTRKSLSNLTINEVINMKTTQPRQDSSVTFDSDFSEDKQIARRILYGYLRGKNGLAAKNIRQLLAERLYEKKDFTEGFTDEKFFIKQHPIIDEISRIITELKTSNPLSDEDDLIEPLLEEDDPIEPLLEEDDLIEPLEPLLEEDDMESLIDEDETMRQFIKTEAFKITFNDFIQNFLFKSAGEKISTDELRYEYQSFFREKNTQFQQKKIQQKAYHLVIDAASPHFQKLVFPEGEELTPKELDSLLNIVGRSISQPLINIWQENKSMVKTVGSDYITRILEDFFERNVEKIIYAIESDNPNQHLDEIQNFLFQKIDSKYWEIAQEKYDQFKKGEALEGEALEGEALEGEALEGKILEGEPSEEHPQSTDDSLERSDLKVTVPKTPSSYRDSIESEFFSPLTTPLSEGDQGSQNPAPLFLTPTSEDRGLKPSPSPSPTNGTKFSGESRSFFKD